MSKRLLAEIESEQQRLKNVIANVPGIVFEVKGAPGDADQSVEFVSDYSEKLLGYNKDELLQDPTLWHRITHPEDRERALEEEKAIWASREGGTTRYRVFAKDGRVVWLEAQTSVICDAAGRPVGRRGVITDVTQQQMEQERQQFVARAADLLSSSLDFATTLEGAAKLAVPFMADCCVVHIFPAEEWPARSAIAHVDPGKEGLMRQLHQRYAPRPAERHPLIQMMETERSVLVGEIGEEQLRAMVHDEAHLEKLKALGFNSYMAVPLIARSKLFGAMTLGVSRAGKRYRQEDLELAEELAGRVALALDNARLYEQAHELAEDLSVAVEAKNEFLGLMSHELRTPITAILGGARMLRTRGERLDEETRTGLLTDIEGESERLARMVENLLVLARLDLGQEVVTEPVLAQRTIEKIAASLVQRRPNRQVEVEAAQDLPPVAAQQTYLEQVLRNLTANAAKYGAPETPIEIRAEQHNGSVEISVLDRGPGVTQEETGLIFERFYRSDRTSHRAGGSGLGLTVCKRLIEAQGGQIWARSREGGGLVVAFTLPLYNEDSGSDS